MRRGRRPKTRFGAGRIALVMVATLALGVVLGWAVGRSGGPGHQTSAEQGRAAPVRVKRPTTQDPPLTETSPHPVIEDEAALTSRPKVPPPQVAMVVPPSREMPPWRRFARTPRSVNGRPMIAVVIDDVGVDRKRAERVVDLPAPVTVSVMTYATDRARLIAEARAHGHEVMLHMPMEPMNSHIDPGPGALLDRQSAAEIRAHLATALDPVEGYVGINNHMGSKFTADEAGMRVVMEELHRRGLLFVDSLTTDHSVGLAVAREFGVPTAGRNVFLDNDPAPAAIDRQLAKTEELARRRGSAIVIGHPRDATLAELSAWLKTVEGRGFALVPVTAVVKARADGVPTQ